MSMISANIFDRLNSKPIIVFSHRRSGTHLLIDLLRKQFKECQSWKYPGEPIDCLYLTMESLFYRRRRNFAQRLVLCFIKSFTIILTIIRSSIQSVINPEYLINNSISAQEAAKVTLNIIFTGILTKKGKKLYKTLHTEKP